MTTSFLESPHLSSSEEQELAEFGDENTSFHERIHLALLHDPFYRGLNLEERKSLKESIEYINANTRKPKHEGVALPKIKEGESAPSYNDLKNASITAISLVEKILNKSPDPQNRTLLLEIRAMLRRLEMPESDDNEAIRNAVVECSIDRIARICSDNHLLKADAVDPDKIFDPYYSHGPVVRYLLYFAISASQELAFLAPTQLEYEPQ